MIAVSILALLMAVAWGSYLTASRSQIRVQSRNERLHAVEQTMNRMVRELSMAFLTTHGQLVDDQGAIEIRYKTGFFGENDRIDFTTLAHVRMFRDDKVGDQAEISYYVKNVETRDGRNVRALVRREDAPIDDEPQKGGTIMTLLEDVKSVEFEFWDDEKADTAAGSDAWVTDWDSESSDQTLRIPSRVRIKIEIPHPNVPRETITFTTQAEIRLITPIDF